MTPLSKSEPSLFALSLSYSFRDDYLDCFGDPETIGKVRDIEDFKCSWLVVKAMELSNEEQKKVPYVRLENYGKPDPKSENIRSVPSSLLRFRSVRSSLLCYRSAKTLLEFMNQGSKLYRVHMAASSSGASLAEGDIGFSDFCSLCLRMSSAHCPSETLGVIDVH
ncbi:hypothetical protein K1719_034838 [Acacia pycnantha]|nr:hypothetical protein K1719_034838 [Acacia pycnantha]